MLIYGFYVWPEGISDSGLYNACVDLLRWTMQAGGIGLVLIALAHGTGRRWAAAADSLLSLLCGLIFLAVGGYWLIVDGGLQPILLLLFGGVLLHGAQLSWKAAGEARAAGCAEVRSPREREPSDPPRAPMVVSRSNTDALKPIDEPVSQDGGDAAADNAGGYLEALGREARRAGGDDGRPKG